MPNPVINQIRAIDPTRTTVLRNQFRIALEKRFRQLLSDIIRSILDNDALALITNAPLPPKAFQFKTTVEKHAAFMEWLQDSVDTGILEVVTREGRLITSRTPWERVFIQSAYQKGISRARSELKKQGMVFDDILGRGGGFAATFNQPFHAERLGLIFSRVFTDLSGITEAMGQDISRVLAQGMAEGRGPREIARLLAKSVNNIGIQRAKVLARTEIIRAHHAANIVEYEAVGIMEVEIVAEFVTAGDGRVCIRCARLAGRRFKIKDAAGIIPVHPNCRCVMIPIVGDNIKTQKRAQTPGQIKEIAGLS